MENIRIETAQNVAIDYEIASIGDRLLAYMVDALIVLALAIFLGTLSAMSIFPDSWGRYALFLFLGVAWLYDLVFEVFMDGQTPGKRSRAIKVVKVDGTQPGIGSYFLRWIIRPIDITLTYGCVAIIAILWNEKGQRVGDIAAGTTVVKLKQRVDLKDTIFTRVEDDYVVKIPQVDKLTDKDIAIIKDVLNSYDSIVDRKLRRKLVDKAKENVQAKIGIRSDIPALEFLSVILKDYNVVQGKL